MGFYLNSPELGSTDKAIKLVRIYKAEPAPSLPLEIKEVPEGKALIVVIENGMFDAALLVPNQQELDYIKNLSDDPRPRTYLLLPKDVAHELSGYERP